VHALNAILPEGGCGTDLPPFLLDDVLAYLSEVDSLTEDEAALKSELEAMPDQARESLSWAIAPARKKGVELWAT
jgi:hypothetical protein